MLAGGMPEDKIDPELYKVEFYVTHTTGGTLNAWVNNATLGKAKLWKRQDKVGGEFTFKALAAAPDGQPVGQVVTAYIEGVHESLNLDDITVQTSFTTGGVFFPAESRTTAITPVINSVTALGGGPVRFINDPPGNSILGLTTEPKAAGGAAGVTIKADVWSQGLKRVGFVQNLLPVRNGWKKQDGVGAVAGDGTLPNGKGYYAIDPADRRSADNPRGAAYPLLDGDPAGANLPEYPALPGENNNAVVTGRVTHTISDSPNIRTPGGEGAITGTWDVAFDLVTYLVARYEDGTVYAVFQHPVERSILRRHLRRHPGRHAD